MTVSPWNSTIPKAPSEIRYPPPVTISSELHLALKVPVPPGWTIGRDGGSVGMKEETCLFSKTLSGPAGPGGPGGPGGPSLWRGYRSIDNVIPTLSLRVVIYTNYVTFMVSRTLID